MPAVGATMRDHVDYPAGTISKFRLVTRREHLKLRNRVLCELHRGAAAKLILVGEAVDQEDGVSRTLAQDWCGPVTANILLSVKRHPRHHLQQVLIISAIDGHG